MSSDTITSPNSSSTINPNSSSTINDENKSLSSHSYLDLLGDYITAMFINKGHHCEYIIYKNHNGFSQIILILDGKTYAHTGHTTQSENGYIVTYRLWEYIHLDDLFNKNF